MPDLLDVLAGFGGEGATLSKGTITAVSTGRLTVRVNGNTFDRVPYMQSGWTPAVNQQVYLLNQAGFGMLALGSPVLPAADPAAPAQGLLTVNPSATGTWTERTQAWAAGSTLTQAEDYARVGAWFYNPADFTAWATRAISKVEMQLQLTSGTPQLALHRNAALTGPPVVYEGPRTVAVDAGAATWVPLPLTWGRDLLAGTASGVVARSQAFDAVLAGQGALRFTSL